jgi:hypothetical protein
MWFHPIFKKFQKFKEAPISTIFDPQNLIRKLKDIMGFFTPKWIPFWNVKIHSFAFCHICAWECA